MGIEEFASPPLFAAMPKFQAHAIKPSIKEATYTHIRPSATQQTFHAFSFQLPSLRLARLYAYLIPLALMTQFAQSKSWLGTITFGLLGSSGESPQNKPSEGKKVEQSAKTEDGMLMDIVKFGWAFRLAGYGAKPQQSKAEEQLIVPSVKPEDGMWMDILKFGWAFRLAGYGNKPQQPKEEEQIAPSLGKTEDGMWMDIIKFGWAFRLAGYGTNSSHQSKAEKQLDVPLVKPEDGMWMDILKFGWAFRLAGYGSNSSQQQSNAEEQLALPSAKPKEGMLMDIVKFGWLSRWWYKPSQQPQPKTVSEETISHPSDRMPINQAKDLKTSEIVPPSQQSPRHDRPEVSNFAPTDSERDRKSSILNPTSQDEQKVERTQVPEPIPKPRTEDTGTLTDVHYSTIDVATSTEIFSQTAETLTDISIRSGPMASFLEEADSQTSIHDIPLSHRPSMYKLSAGSMVLSAFFKVLRVLRTISYPFPDNTEAGAAVPATRSPWLKRASRSTPSQPISDEYHSIFWLRYYIPNDRVLQIITGLDASLFTTQHEEDVKQMSSLQISGDFGAEPVLERNRAAQRL